MITIDKNIPIPNGADWESKPEKYPFAEMEIGDSFFIACKDSMAPLCQSSLELAALSYASEHNLDAKFVTRAVLGGVRVWRVK